MQATGMETPECLGHHHLVEEFLDGGNGSSKDSGNVGQAYLAMTLISEET